MPYEEYWGLSEPTFENTPDPRFYFPSTKHQESVRRLMYGVSARKGAVLLSGEIGCGKTVLSRELILNLPPEKYDVALIANPTYDVTDFLKELLYQLDIHCNGADSKVELLRHLNNHLLRNHKNGVATIVMVDEAQAIRDERIFEELRLLLNFQLNDRFLLTLVMLGQPELQDRLMTIPELCQRIAIRYHLAPFDPDETTSYIQFRLKISGCEKEIFTRNAFAKIFQHTSGIPRRINTLCDLCLLTGYMEKAEAIDENMVVHASSSVL